MTFFARFYTFSKKDAHGADCRRISRSGTSFTIYNQIWSVAGPHGEVSLFDRVLEELVMSQRVICGREVKRSMMIIDSKSVKNTDVAAETGYDAAKRNIWCETASCG
jgi:hypothetical protein